jgi:hypothetical protein
MTNDELKLQSWKREAADVIIPELTKLFKKRRWEAESVYVALEFFLKDLKKQFPLLINKGIKERQGSRSTMVLGTGRLS